MKATESQKEKPTPPPLSEQYYKSRKQLALYSGLLFAWEFIGIELPGPNESLFPNLNISLKSPQAVPWVLLVLIFYFGFRTVMEWLQAEPDRRTVKISRIDYYTTLTIPVAALVTFTIQRLLEIQIADKLEDSEAAFTLLLVLIAVPIGGYTGICGGVLYSSKKFKVPKEDLRFKKPLVLRIFIFGLLFNLFACLIALRLLPAISFILICTALLVLFPVLFFMRYKTEAKIYKEVLPNQQGIS